MTKFQAIVIAIFIIFIIVGVAFFATFKGKGGVNDRLPAITVWGTFPGDVFSGYVSKMNQSLAVPLSVNYVQKTQAGFSQEFIAALARGTGPDAILIPEDMLLPHIDKIVVVPYSALSQRAYKDTYVQESEIYLTSEGTEALPFMIDPLIMYWNRDTFASVGLATYPKFWNEFIDLNKKITTKDTNGNIRKSAIAMGNFSNVLNARELLGSLIMQIGNPITSLQSGLISSALKSDPSPAPAVEYFTQFSDPNSSTYSWNRALPDSKTSFLSGNLATYFGFASELNDIRAKNQNLNFDAAPLPQLRTGGIKATYGRMYGFSILKSSPRQNPAYQVLSLLTAPGNLASLSDSLYLPSVRRDIIAAGSKDPYISIFDQAALVAKTWLDADPAMSFSIMSDMVDAVTSGAKSVRDAIVDASDQYDVVLHRAVQ